MKLQKIFYSFSILVFAFGSLLFLQNNSFAQKKVKPKATDKVIFEITRSGFSLGIRSINVLRIYKSGRVDCEKSKERPSETTNSKKNKCFQISRAAVAELTGLAKLRSFINADEIYVMPGGGIDFSSKRIITSFLTNKSKTIELNSVDGDDDSESLPKSVKEFINKIAEIDSSFQLPPG